MGNDALRVTVDVCRGSLVRAQVGVRRGTETILLHLQKNAITIYFYRALQLVVLKIGNLVILSGLFSHSYGKNVRGKNRVLE
jgi:hypothetical protein